MACFYKQTIAPQPPNYFFKYSHHNPSQRLMSTFAAKICFTMAIQIGQAAPDFTLRDTEKKAVSLSEQKGKNVVLLFFPLAFTSVCTKELCSVRDNLAFYNNTNAIVFGISVDSLFSLGKFKEEQNLNFTLLSDFNKDASRAYGCIYEDWFNDMKGVSKRSAFVIDGEGIVRYAEVLENAGDIPNFDAIQNCLQQLS
jgi:glutaredoxin-dependent peroxiredoxin